MLAPLGPSRPHRKPGAAAGRLSSARLGARVLDATDLYVVSDERRLGNHGQEDDSHSVREEARHTFTHTRSTKALLLFPAAPQLTVHSWSL